MIKLYYSFFALFVSPLFCFQASDYEVHRCKLNGFSDSYLYSENEYGKYQLIGNYAGWDKEGGILQDITVLILRVGSQKSISGWKPEEYIWENLSFSI